MCNDIEDCLDVIAHQSSGARTTSVQSVNLLTELLRGLSAAR